MEVLLNYEWNVYKIFKNGKRAKIPFFVFEYPESRTIEEYFESKIKITFSKKLQRSNFILIRDDMPQDYEDPIKKQNKIFEEKKKCVLRNHLKNVDLVNNNKIIGGLIFCRDNNWKWQWAAIEAGTSRYLHGISPVFSLYSEADEWMQNEIDQL